MILEYLELVERRTGISTARAVGLLRRKLTFKGVVAVLGFMTFTTSLSPTPVEDAGSWALTKAQTADDAVNTHFLNTESVARWTRDVLDAYRMIKLTKSAYQAVANFNLAANINVVDLMPMINLPNEGLFGADDPNGPQNTSQTLSNGNKLNSSLALRFTSTQGGFASTFSNWGKFKPNLKINLSQIASQLSNIDFDAAEVTQLTAPDGHPIAQTYKVLDPAERLGKITSVYNNVVTETLNWTGYFEKKREAQDSLNAQLGSIVNNYNNELQYRRNLLRKEETLEQSLQQAEDDAFSFSDLNPSSAQSNSEKWAFRRQRFEKEAAANQAALNTLVAEKANELNSVMTAVEAVRKTNQFMQESTTNAVMIDNARAAVVDANKKYDSQKAEILRSAGVYYRNDDDLSGMQIEPGTWMQLQALENERKKAVDLIINGLSTNMARAEQLRKLQSSVSEVDDKLVDPIAKGIVTNSKSGLDSFVADLGQAMTMAKNARYKADQAILQAEVEAQIQAQNQARNAIANLDGIMDQYFSTFVYMKTRNGGTALTSGGLPVYLVAKALKTYAGALKATFGRANLADVMLNEEEDAQKQAADSYKAYLDSVMDTAL